MGYKITNKTKKKHLQTYTTINSKLFTISNLEQILSIPNLKHGDDYILAKKIIKNGEEWIGRLPYDTIPLQDISGHVHYGGFSIIVNKVQRLWKSISILSRQLWNDTHCNYVSCNLYMTPAVNKQQQQNKQNSYSSSAAFESHYDWMDVIIIQISGIKLWSVANTSIIKLTTCDLKHKPTTNELNYYYNNKYNDFLLYPGDILYIPRGYIHNASTILLNNNEQNHGDPSIHLSFGIEHLSDTTWEGFIHYAFVQYYTNNHHKQFLSKEQIIISSNKYCNNNHIKITWNIFLHYAISALARLDVISNKHSKDYNKSYILRKSIPIHPIWNNIETSTTKNSTIYNIIYKKQIIPHMQKNI